MKPIVMFYQTTCPHCQRAFRWMDAVMQAHPEYAAIPLERVEEREQAERANAHDYWYVPTFYVDGEKVHEGVASQQIIEGVFEKAYQ
ncbi:MAG: thioredoxin family protein [Oscillospiraceae bacterium]|nr:thioredoxin family protein [Oscillospiraceae bacterium]